MATLNGVCAEWSCRCRLQKKNQTSEERAARPLTMAGQRKGIAWVRALQISFVISLHFSTCEHRWTSTPPWKLGRALRTAVWYATRLAGWRMKASEDASLVQGLAGRAGLTDRGHSSSCLPKDWGLWSFPAAPWAVGLLPGVGAPVPRRSLAPLMHDK